MIWWDPVAILVCVAGVVWGWKFIGAWTLIAPYVLGTFFLFCNVFRVRRNAELFWASAFLVVACLTLAMHPSLLVILAVQTPITVVVLIREVRSPGYRGIGARAQKSQP